MSSPLNSQQLPQDEPSFWAAKLGIPSFKENRVKWNSDWEKALNSFGNASEVIEVTMHGIKALRAPAQERTVSDQQAADSSAFLAPMTKVVRARQQSAAECVKFFLELGMLKLDTVWLLLEASEQRKYLLQGIQDACGLAFAMGQDLRAFCPEITVSGLAAQRGKAFLDFIHRYHDLYTPAETGKIFAFPNSWWEEGANNAANAVDSKVKIRFEGATVMTNEFIACFIFSIMTKIGSNIVTGGGGMKPATDLIVNTDDFFCESMARMKTTLRDKPLIRCENCEKTPEEIGPNACFMVCSTCKVKLNFSVHYCSQNCQSADWKTHKRSCGKKKVTKGLPGTAGDRLWMYQDPNVAFLRDLPKNATGKTLTAAIGIGPAQYTRPAALESQVSMLEKDKEADYFLFNDNGQPIRFVVDKMWTQCCFRGIRQVAMTTPEKRGFEALREYLIKLMANSPGLSRDLILKQLTAEYGADAPERVTVVERKSAGGRTYIQACAENIARAAPMFG
ncbi:hypothetical protein HYDPIDRAFT_32346 [Hydnomerulius pinastri MD-312]|uniref:MYND-type domain-containing protein n=1 Tax=Hydnomerulius pinastri MD-312 TaxID=994086 RepID=A0A0C9WAA7_9AGAM|nr:hypothetical protein HYDPIDRAFT_32346 [Hydnomerulius pinastri MD-312]